MFNERGYTRNGPYLLLYIMRHPTSSGLSASSQCILYSHSLGGHKKEISIHLLVPIIYYLVPIYFLMPSNVLSSSVSPHTRILRIINGII